MTQYQRADLSRVKTISIATRKSKVTSRAFARPFPARGDSFRAFVNGLPDILLARDLRILVDSLVSARRKKKQVILMMGAHVVKVGLSPVLVDLLRRGLITAVAMNSAAAIHDVETALWGKTSEDVAANLSDGRFGMARETGEFIHGTVKKAFEKGGVGLGTAVGERLLEEGAPFAHLSILATAARCGVPVTVHVALGTDIIHMHPAMDGGAMGALSHHDFRLFSRLVSTLEGGVFINLGSAVILPEVFLKAVSVVRNLGFSLAGITTVNMDFQRHYRPQVNIVERPTAGSGRGISLIGHHEIMFPLLMAAVIEKL